MTELERAWLAGFFDGEGCIASRFTTNSILVSISQRDRQVLEYIQGLLGFGQVARNGSVHELRFTSKIAMSQALELVQPYSLVKREQIDWALQLLERVPTTDELELLRSMKGQEQVPSPPDQVTNPVWAWVSGFFDAEGCISDVEFHTLRVTVTQKNRGSLDYVQGLVGGGGIRISKKTGTHQFRIYRKTAVRDFLQAIRPYSQVKATQIDLALTILDQGPSEERFQQLRALKKTLRADNRGFCSFT